MTSRDKIFINCDDLDKIPNLNRENYIFEHDLLVEMLPKNAKVLQVGSMDGIRAVRLLKARPDLDFTGLEIEMALVKAARKNAVSENLSAKFIDGDITSPPKDLGRFDYVLCLNNTLGYISDYKKAIKIMLGLGDKVVLSVYGEKFTDDLAREYFKTMGLEIEKIENNKMTLKGFSIVSRFNLEEVRSWGVKITETPIGYFCELS